eukprot:TRINITY_DN23910_c0_g1_i1.p1 TRINITY_DN23910_c0_g1~~TRINITY_DN23910_c0_g1_i1.p1  ORF type:complete len:344 (-),score=78.90 TRINITY_DN23910_c0_g1_i1:95-1126(-)
MYSNQAVSTSSQCSRRRPLAGKLRYGMLAAATLLAFSSWRRMSYSDAFVTGRLKSSGADRRSSLVLRFAVQPLVSGPSEVFKACVEDYSPEDKNEPFVEGPPPTGFRNMEEAIRPYHPNPEWQIFPGEVGSFERDQKICSTYTLASGIFNDINKCLREDNEDGLRRLAPFLWEIREILRFETKKICKKDGRKVKPFMGKVLRGLEVPEDELDEWAKLYSKVGTEFSWPAFTSCQQAIEEGEGGDDKKSKGQGLWPFDGNLNFEITCNIDPSKSKSAEIFAPVAIKRFIGGSNEVLFPPHTKFKVTGAKGKEKVTEHDITRNVYTVQLEVTELPLPAKIGERRR